MQRLIPIFVIIIFSLCNKYGFGQVPPPAPVVGPFNTARIVITDGGRVDFIFNTIDDYFNGVTLDAGPPDLSTMIGVELQNDATTLTMPSAWDLFVEMDGDLNGPGGRTITAETIEIECIDASGGIIPAASFVAGYRSIPVTPARLRIVNSGPPGDPFDNRVQLNFRCANPANVHPAAETLLEKDPGYYSAILIITLEPDF